MNNVVWLASYPRSGNTWLRVFLTNLRRHSENPASINDLEKNPIFSGVNMLESMLGIDVDCMTSEEFELILPEAIRWHSEQANDITYHKIHDARHTNTNGESIIPSDATKLIIYIMRNPLDLCVSLAHFTKTPDIDRTIETLNNRSNRIGNDPRGFSTQFPQLTSSWSGHIKSWTKNHEMRICIVRYEDMVTDPIPTFKRIALAAKIPCSDEQLESAIELSSFNLLQAQETKHGFSEKPSQARSFFREGKIGTWREELSEDQAQRIIKHNQETMTQFGYLDADLNPVF